jgi:hypothetical protein
MPGGKNIIRLKSLNSRLFFVLRSKFLSLAVDKHLIPFHFLSQECYRIPISNDVLNIVKRILIF